MRSVFYIPGNNEKMISEAPETPADIIYLRFGTIPYPLPRNPKPETWPEKISNPQDQGFHRLCPGQQLGDIDDQ